MKKFNVEIIDRCEGTLTITITAETEDEALEEASIYASEMGCSHVEEIIVMEG